jgi:hypothetical protein
VSENLALRRPSGSKREKVTEGWRKLHEELRILFSSPKIRVIPNEKYGMGGTSEIHLGRYFFLENLKGRDHFVDLGINEKVMLKGS